MKRNKYVELVANQANVSYNDALARMKFAREKHGINFRTFYNSKLYYKNEIRLLKFAEGREAKKQDRLDILNEIEALSGASPEQTSQRMHDFQETTGYTLTAAQYMSYRLYELDDDKAKELVIKLRERAYLLKKLKTVVKELYTDGEGFESVQDQLDKVKALIGETISEETREEILEKIKSSEFDISSYSADELEALIVDIEYMKNLFDYSYIEYFMFGFIDKDLSERLEFLSITEKRAYAETVCDPFDSDLLDSKWLTFKKLEKFYKRSAAVIEDENSYKSFENFCNKKKKFIAKPLTELKGEGIELYDTESSDCPTCKEIFDHLLGLDSYIVEELIRQNTDFGSFNPDSVNTVRIISYYDKKDVQLKWTFIRVGRKGSFVDNAGAGGVFAAIDTETGVIISDAYDENGLCYEKHPDSGIVFKGFEIPKWKELLGMCREAALMLPNVRYIGWDFTYTTDNEWVLVEANIQPGCRAIQAATNKGIRREFLDMFEKGEGSYEKKNSYVISVAQKADISYENALALMDNAKEKYGIPYRYFDLKNLHLANDIRMKKYGEACEKNRILKEEHYQNIFDKTGLDEEAVDIIIDKIKTVCDFNASVTLLDNYNLFELDEEELYSAIYRLKNRNKLVSKIRSTIKKIDKKEATYDDIAENVEILRDNIRGLVSEPVVVNAKELIAEAFPERSFTEEELFELIVDIRLTNLILDFNTAEYLTYHFEGKSVEYKHKFIANTERLYWTKMVNDKKTSETLDDKYLSYLRFKEHYNRNVMLMENDDCYEEFCNFCKSTPNFVKKPLTESQGKGVGLVRVDESTDTMALFRELREDSDRMILEGVIEQSDITSVFNSDSVNTVRIITFNNGGDVRLMWSFFRTGRKGSFVDNAGSGGVFAGVDVKTGILESDGGDERGRKFECHPESNVKYKGFQLPEWDKAEELAKELARAIPSMSYVGWDFAYDKDNKWVIVEYNSHPEFVQQGPTDHGCRDEFLETIEIYKEAHKKPGSKKKKSIFERAIRKIKKILK